MSRKLGAKIMRKETPTVSNAIERSSNRESPGLATWKILDLLDKSRKSGRWETEPNWSKLGGKCPEEVQGPQNRSL